MPQNYTYLDMANALTWIEQSGANGITAAELSEKTVLDSIEIGIVIEQLTLRGWVCRTSDGERYQLTPDQVTPGWMTEDLGP